jgi:predicted GIY-YIG superfamily endonuclease
MLMHVKPKKKPILKNCIYQIECECKAKYIGQTKRPLKIRVKEHQKALGEIQCEWNKNHNKLALHAQKMNHAVDFQNTTVIHFENKWNQRLVAESMAMIAKDNVISQSSRTIDKIFWKNIKDNEKNTRGMNYFCEKSRLNDVITHNVSQSTPVPPTPATPPIRPLPHSYNLRTRAAALA